VLAQQSHIVLTNLVCIIDDAIGVLPQFNSIYKCEQLMWILLHISQNLF
jgi:hypothetical protein